MRPKRKPKSKTPTTLEEWREMPVMASASQVQQLGFHVMQCSIALAGSTTGRFVDYKKFQHSTYLSLVLTLPDGTQLRAGLQLFTGNTANKNERGIAGMLSLSSDEGLEGKVGCGFTRKNGVSRLGVNYLCLPRVPQGRPEPYEPFEATLKSGRVVDYQILRGEA